MRYLKFRNISILLEVQEIDKFLKKYIYRSFTLRNSSENGTWQTLPMVVGTESHTSKVVPEYAPISKKQKQTKNKTHRPSLPTQ
jgi:hypothetical protein